MTDWTELRKQRAREERAEHRKREAHARRFADEMLVPGTAPVPLELDLDYQLGRTLYDAYNAWCEDQGLPVMLSPHDLVLALRRYIGKSFGTCRMGITRRQSSARIPITFVYGVKLRGPEV